MKHSRIHIKGFKRSFKVCQIGSNIDLANSDSVVAYLLKHYATFTPSMMMQVYRQNYTAIRLDR